MSLLPAVLAAAAVRGWHAVRWPALGALALTLASVGFGYLRIPSDPPQGSELAGMAVIDDFIGARTGPEQIERIWSQYERHIAALAEQGARIVVLPEKIVTVPPPIAELIRQRLSAAAARSKVWLAAGVATDDGRQRLNLAWLFDPAGRLDANYQKHHMAPPEREFVPGTGFELRTIGGARYGLAICKDMHFAEMGLAYGRRGADAMLVPAWDFGEDGEYAARMSALRGVESGFAMVRASRQGLLTITDAYGRIVAQTASATLPGATLLGQVPGPGPGPTFYTRTGELFGWLCTALAAALLLLSWRSVVGLPSPLATAIPARPS
jgi:apolipoprotein N-acyltransferase